MFGKNKLIRLQIARTGVFGADGRTITLQDLQDVVDTFDGKAPISLGHYAARQDWMPSWGNVENLMLEVDGEGGGTLVADISVRSELWDAIKSGFYPGWSVSIPPKPDGKHYLHHLAFLGAMPPAIRDLRIIRTADGDDAPEGITSEDGHEFEPDVSAVYSYADFPEEGRAQEVVSDEEQGGGDGGGGGTGSDEDDGAGGTDDGQEDPPEPGPNDFSDPPQGQDPQVDKTVAKARKAYAASVRASLDKAMEGRVNPALRKKVHEFADQAVASWDFSDDAEEPAIITLFKEILEGMGKAPRPGRMDFSDQPEEKAGRTASPAELAMKF